jgi:hypothetical protein
VQAHIGDANGVFFFSALCHVQGQGFLTCCRIRNWKLDIACISNDVVVDVVVVVVALDLQQCINSGQTLGIIGIVGSPRRPLSLGDVWRVPTRAVLVSGHRQKGNA